jgi:molybdopterin-biosynthesis enzyme MoeA-like protein
MLGAHRPLAPGGIKSTHCDITADCVAKAFDVPIDSDPRAHAILHEWVKTTGAKLNVVLLARDAQKLALAKRVVEDMLERVRPTQSNRA